MIWPPIPRLARVKIDLMEIKSEEYKDYLKGEFLTVHEAAAFLEVSEKELWRLVHKHEVPTQTLAGAFLRRKKQDIEELKNKWRIERELFPRRSRYFAHASTVEKPTVWEGLSDFWYFNDFYVIGTAIVALLLYFIISSQ